MWNFASAVLVDTTDHRSFTQITDNSVTQVQFTGGMNLGEFVNIHLLSLEWTNSDNYVINYYSTIIFFVSIFEFRICIPSVQFKQFLTCLKK